MIFRRLDSPESANSRISCCDAEQVARPVPVTRRLQRLGDGGQQLPQRLTHRLGDLGPVAHGLAQEPNPVPDVALLVVVDLRVALHEARQQPDCFR